MDIKLKVPEIFPDMNEFWKHLRAARLEFLEAVKALAQARIDQIKEGSKKSKLREIEVK
ncbi:MAG: hypothetical protein R3291_04030 [Thermoplasmata archaeon]|nr:hypothetical protein [Thermoplasmata archaeon]